MEKEDNTVLIMWIRGEKDESVEFLMMHNKKIYIFSMNYFWQSKVFRGKLEHPVFSLEFFSHSKNKFSRNLAKYTFFFANNRILDTFFIYTIYLSSMKNI